MSSGVYNSLPKIELTEDTVENVYYRYNFEKDLWISNIAIKDKKIVLNSNLFMQMYQSIQEYGDNYRKPHFIYSRIKTVYDNSVNDIDNKNFIEINDKCIMLHNSFSSGNAGHDLQYILDTLTKYLDKKEIKFVLFNEINEKTYNVNIIKLLVPNDRIIFIDKDKTYNFKNLIIKYERSIYNISNYLSIIDNIRNKIISLAKDTYTLDELNKMNNKIVILIKTDKMNNVTRKDDMFYSSELYKNIKEDNKYYIGNPEEDCFLKFAYILLNSSNILTGQRGISCANQIYFNNNAEIYGFIPGGEKLSISKSYIERDISCNEYYYNRMKFCIYCPISIKKDDVNILKSLFN